MDWIFEVDWQGLVAPTYSILEMVIRGTLMYLALLAILRFVANRQAGSIGLSDILVIVIIADVAQNAFSRQYESLTEGVVLVLTILPRRRGRIRRSTGIHRGAGNDSGGAHHVEHARDEAEQQKYNEPPGRDTEQPVDEPANAGTDQHASNEFAREPEAPGVARCSRGPISTRTIRRCRLGTSACLA